MKKLLRLTLLLCPYTKGQSPYKNGCKPLSLRGGVWGGVLLALLCPVLSLAQPNYTPLTIGTKLPNVTLDSMVNYTAPSGTLAAFKGKLIILDFFATWCGACKKKLPALDSLQQKYQQQLQVLLVSSRSKIDDVKRVQAFYNKYESSTGKKLCIPAVVKDTALFALFPHSSLPHYVWLDAELKVLAITTGEMVTEANIVKMIEANKNIHPKTTHND